MHFHAALGVIDSGDVLELSEIEICIEFAIDAHQQVQIESRGNSKFVVVRAKKLCARLQKVSAQQKRIPRLKNAPDFGKELSSGGTIKISNGAAEKQHEKMLTGAALGSDFEQSVEIFALEAEDADGIDIAEFAFAHHESGAGNLNGIVCGALTAAKSLQQMPRLSSRAAAKFRYGDRAFKAIDYVPAMAAEQAFIGSREPVFGKAADYFKER
jgi:hypothetical protein